MIELDGPGEVLFETPAGVSLVGATLTVPPHAGAVVDAWTRPSDVIRIVP